MPFLQDIPSNQGEVAIIIESSEPTATVLRQLGNQEWFANDEPAAISSYSSRESTPLLAQGSRFFSLARQTGKDGLRFGSGEDVAFKFPRESPHYTFISRRHFRVFVNQHNSWMLEDTSKNGMRVNDEKIHRTQIALHPEKRNFVSLGSLELFLHICSSVDIKLEHNADETLDLEDLELQTQTQTQTQICSALRSPESRTPAMLPDKYHILTASVPSVVQSVKRVVEKSSGRHALGKFYASLAERRMAGKAFIKLFAILKGHPNLLPFIEEATFNDQYVIITDFKRGCSLEALIQDSYLLDAPDILKIHLQIGCGALRWLNERNIMHRSIRPAVILLNKRGPVHAQLTGFSEWCEGPQSWGMVGPPKYRAPEMQAGSVYDAAVDVYSLCALTHETIALTGQMQPITRIDLNNLIDRGMLQHPDTRPTPSEMEDAITDIIGGHDVNWSPFTYFTARKKYVINAARQEHEDSIAALDLVTLLRAYDPDKFISDCIDSLPPWTRIGTNKQQVSLRLAARYCHQLGLEDLRSFFMDATAKGRRKGPFQLQWHHIARVHYHAPSLMINISDITKIGTSKSAIDLSKARCLQRVLGVSHLEGFYVDHAFFGHVCKILREKDIWQIKMPDLTQYHNPTLERRFVEVDYPHYTIIVTELVNPNMILLRAKDWTIHAPMLRGVPCAWHRPLESANFIPLEEGLRICDHKQIAALLSQLQGLSTAEAQSTPVDSTKSIKTSTSYQRLEAEHTQETDLEFYFGTKLTPRKRTVAERSDDGDATKGERSASKTVPPSVTAWLADVRPCRSLTRYNTR